MWKYMLIDTVVIYCILLLLLLLLLLYKVIKIGAIIQKADKTSNNECLCSLNIFCWDKWFLSLINWMHISNLKQFTGIIE